MSSSVKSLPNHYDTLGVLPTASQDEIARAFSRAMSMYGARSLHSAAQIGAAFEVLRNPAKRRAYDGAMGIRPEPYRWTPGSGNALMGSAWTDLAGRVAGDSSPSAPRPGLQARLESGAEPRVASFIASSLRESPIPAQRVQEPIPTEEEEHPHEETSPRAVERHLADVLAASSGDRSASEDHEVRTLEWKRPATALGGLVVAAGLIGGLAGLWAEGSPQPLPVQAEPQATVTVPLPKPEVIPASAQTSLPAATHRQSEQRPAKFATANPQASAPQPDAAPAEQQAQEVPAPAAASDSTTQPGNDQAATEAAPASVVEAKIPLPKATIARTIEKIGYSCGTVASIAALEGASPGVFKVSCSSGQDYRATPVNGRYHFHRLGS